MFTLFVTELLNPVAIGVGIISACAVVSIPSSASWRARWVEEGA